MQIFWSFPRLLVVLFLVELFDVVVVVFFARVYILNNPKRMPIYDNHIITLNRFSRV